MAWVEVSDDEHSWSTQAKTEIYMFSDYVETGYVKNDELAWFDASDNSTSWVDQ
jgi:hypothetical protein